MTSATCAMLFAGLMVSCLALGAAAFVLTELAYLWGSNEPVQASRRHRFRRDVYGGVFWRHHRRCARLAYLSLVVTMLRWLFLLWLATNLIVFVILIVKGFRK
jgi:hypothetical protein